MTSARFDEIQTAFEVNQAVFILWQKSARKLIRPLHERQHYDLMHHVTFAGFCYPSPSGAMAFHPFGGRWAVSSRSYPVIALASSGFLRA
jgi:hypothetical protein